MEGIGRLLAAAARNPMTFLMVMAALIVIGLVLSRIAGAKKDALVADPQPTSGSEDDPATPK